MSPVTGISHLDLDPCIAGLTLTTGWPWFSDTAYSSLLCASPPDCRYLHSRPGEQNILRPPGKTVFKFSRFQEPNWHLNMPGLITYMNFTCMTEVKHSWILCKTQIKKINRYILQRSSTLSLEQTKHSLRESPWPSADCRYIYKIHVHWEKKSKN